MYPHMFIKSLKIFQSIKTSKCSLGAKLAEIFIFEAESCLFSLKNFKGVFLETLFLKISNPNAHISESFALKRLGEVSIDPKFYLVFGYSHNSVPQ